MFHASLKEKNNLKYFEIEQCFDDEMLDELFHTFNYMRPHLKPADSTGSAVNEDGTPKKKNSALFLHECIPYPRITEMVHNLYFDKFAHFIMDSPEITPDNIYSTITTTNWESHLLSYYHEDMHGYDYHTDSSVFTLIMWFINGEKNYTGGELHLPDHDITLNCDHNTGIIFPGHVKHGVMPLKIIDKERDSGRIAYSVFTGKDREWVNQ